ncbi:hypothetical protein [Kaistella palustris]|uniref:hypothetical protein n=1 Tax=Kaistella palustris TaxID=493376 RepID=UPI0004001860|nr:hypothetical protein [Kaistella palustris]
MEPLYSLLTFPQSYTAGQLFFNIVLLPRNIDLRKPIGANIPSFLDGDFQFETKIINELDGLPLFSAVTDSFSPNIPFLPANKKAVIEEIIVQMEEHDGLKISDDPNVNLDKGAKTQMEAFALKNVAIKKYLPHTYRESFNFTTARTRFAVTDDEYECIIKNKDKKLTDSLTDRKFISWGKLIAFILRNPLLAEKAGFIYKASIPVEGELLKKGGWIFTKFAAGSAFGSVLSAVYAARLPSLTKDRILFAPVLFPVQESAANNATYDAVMQESILYNDGFAKIVHAQQPVNQDLLQEKDTSNPPVKDVGLRLGWDDEQLTIWGNRQLRQKDEITELPIDAPLGVFGYKVDVRKLGGAQWLSQNMVRATQDILMQNGELLAGLDQAFELPTEVHPSSHGNTMEEGFWLPMYFASWNGHAMVIPDKEAEEIHLLASEHIPVPGLDPTNAVNLSPKKTFHPYSQDESQKLPLRYGEDYQFRIRLMDISGGSPAPETEPLNGGQKPIADVHFRRNIKAGALNVLNIDEFYENQTSELVKDASVLENILGEGNMLRIKRPDLGYPGVVYTGKYSNAAQLLKDKINAIVPPGDPTERKQHSIGLPDPDVNSFEIIVEVKSLEMDNVLSETGRDPYVIWQKKRFKLPANIPEENYDMECSVNIVYRDFKVIDFDNNFTEDPDSNDLVLPTSRQLRLTFVPIVDFADDDYAAEFVAKGNTLLLTSFKTAQNELDLLSPIKGGLRAFYLQPETKPELASLSKTKLDAVKISPSRTSPELLRLTEALDLNAHELTLEGKKGQRVQFGVSNELRHSLAPESGSVAFSSVKELFNRWLVSVDFSLLRDWAWQGVKIDSFTVKRSVQGFEDELREIGSIQLKDVANMSMLSEPARQESRIIFLDSIDPKKFQKEFPRELKVTYTLTPNFKNNLAEANDVTTLTIDLPVTVIPHQIPKLISAGLALSPYQYDKDNYQFSEERRKYIWLEFDSPPVDPEDTYFCRVLASAPDPYLCRMNMDLVSELQADLPFILNPEEIREIIPNMTNDFAGLGIMQEMIPEKDAASKTFLLPLPEGLHAESEELFGFFTYEIRVGHKKEVWSTAQGRYGRPLKVNGIQHPAPELVCTAIRSEIKSPFFLMRKSVEISAPHSNAVLNGKTITAFPPNTSLWYCLYTQVIQADGQSFRNILIDSGPMYYQPKRSSTNPDIYMKEGGNKLGTARLDLQDIGKKLEALGLPKSNNLSAIAVEVFPMDNKWQFDWQKRGTPESSYVTSYLQNRSQKNPLTELLGQHRIYRSSKLTRIQEVCCEDC